MPLEKSLRQKTILPSIRRNWLFHKIRLKTCSHVRKGLTDNLDQTARHSLKKLGRQLIGQVVNAKIAMQKQFAAIQTSANSELLSVRERRSKDLMP